MTIFQIEYRDPQTGEWKQAQVEFCDATGVSAKDWAEDYAYTLADKGEHVVKETL